MCVGTLRKALKIAARKMICIKLTQLGIMEPHLHETRRLIVFYVALRFDLCRLFGVDGQISVINDAGKRCYKLWLWNRFPNAIFYGYLFVYFHIKPATSNDQSPNSGIYKVIKVFFLDTTQMNRKVTIKFILHKCRSISTTHIFGVFIQLLLVWFTHTQKIDSYCAIKQISAGGRWVIVM